MFHCGKGWPSGRSPDFQSAVWNWVFAQRIANRAWPHAATVVWQEAGRKRPVLAAFLQEKKSEDLFDTDRDFAVEMRRFYCYGTVHL